MDKYIIRISKSPLVYLGNHLNNEQVNNAARIVKTSFINNFNLVKRNGWSWLKFDDNGKLIEVTELE
jgi:hypothetical protein